MLDQAKSRNNTGHINHLSIFLYTSPPLLQVTPILLQQDGNPRSRRLHLHGQHKTMYNHWDSNPKSQGRRIALFVRRLSAEQCAEMADLVENIEWIEDGDEIIPEDIMERYLAFDGGIWKYDWPIGGPEHWYEEHNFEGLSGQKKNGMVEKDKELAVKVLRGEGSGASMRKGYDTGLCRRATGTWGEVLVGGQGARGLREIAPFGGSH
ncbi:hypothetical protein IAR50_001141 [Cryptococcus sp. DSM 104548]